MSNMRGCSLCNAPFPDDLPNCPKCGAVHTTDGGKKVFWVIGAILIAVVAYYNLTSEPDTNVEYRAP